MDLSIIVPIYNMELYLEKCLSTLVNQKNNRYSYEIICVNDGSTDNSQEILNNYNNKHKDRIKIINTENFGVSNARNIGIENSIGKYITFVDSDDWVSEDFVRLSVESIEENNVDLVVFDSIYSGDKEFYHNENISFTIFNTENHACGKVFKKDLIDKYEIKFPVGITIGEDLTFTFSYICTIKDYKHIPLGVYYYRQDREGSAMTSSIKNKYNEVNDACMLLYNFSKKNFLLEEKYKEIEYIFIKNIIIRNTMKILKNNRSLVKIYKEIKEQISFVEEIFKNWRNNYYVVNNADLYLSSKLGSNYLQVLNNIERNIVRAVFYFIVGKFICKGDKNGNNN